MYSLAIPVIASVLGGITGALMVYILSGRRVRKEWRTEKQAEVVSELYRLLSDVENTAGLATRSGVPLELRRQRMTDNQKALRKLLFYYSGNALWMAPEWLPDLQAFLNGLSSALGPYETELSKDTPDSTLAIAAAEHVQMIVPQAQRVLGTQFRAIVGPTSCREHLADALDWLETRGRNLSGTPSQNTPGNKKNTF